MRRSLLGLLALALTALPLHAESADRADVPVTLRGSLSAMMRQHSIALALGYEFVENRADMAELIARGELVRLEGNADYGFRRGVRSLVARPEMGTFIERLGRDYRAACDEQLVVTSLTRPLNRQPSNAHRLSVHPAGIAVDLRVSRRPECRRWLEAALLDMEERGVLDVTREYYPPHYHIALFPAAYMEAVAPMIAEEERARAAREMAVRLQAERELARFAAVEGATGARALRAGAGAAEGLSLFGLLPMMLSVAVMLRWARPTDTNGRRILNRACDRALSAGTVGRGRVAG